MWNNVCKVFTRSVALSKLYTLIAITITAGTTPIIKLEEKNFSSIDYSCSNHTTAVIWNDNILL